MDKWLIKPTTSRCSDIIPQSKNKDVQAVNQPRGEGEAGFCSDLQGIGEASKENSTSEQTIKSGTISYDHGENNQAGSSSVATESSVSSIKTPRKKRKQSSKRFHRFNVAWLQNKDFKDWLVRSSKIGKDDFFEYGACKVCDVTIFPNKTDILRHSKSEKHSNLMKTVQTTRNLNEMMSGSHFYSVRNAELKLAAAVTTNNIPFKFMDILSPLCAQIFPDSKIAMDIACKRTKTTSIIKENIGKHIQEELISLLQKPGAFFSLIMDETTDKGTVKQCAFTVTYFCTSKNKIVTRFFDMIEVSAGTANDLYKYLRSIFDKKKIPLNNLVGFASDTTNVMVGERNSIFSHLKSDLPEIALIRCSCHMIHLCASRACLELPRRVEDVLRNIGAHFSRSFSRQEKFKEFQLFFKADIHKILLPSQTRWLSLEQCCSRILEQYEPLKEYFRLVCFEDPSITNDTIYDTLNNYKFTKVYLEFMVYVLNILNNFNTTFQSESPLLHKLKPEVTNLLRTLYSNYINLDSIKNCDILNFDHQNPRHFVPNEKIYLGMAAHETLSDLKKDSTFDSDDSMNTFYTSCLKFYIKLVSEIKQRFTFNDEVFNVINVLEPKSAQTFEQKSLIHIFQRFSFLSEFVDKQELDNEWRTHALLDHTALGLNVNLPADEYWAKVFELKNAGDSDIFKNLKIVIRFLLILPFSNASVERIFSDLNNVKTDLRNRLNTDTLVAILATKDSIKHQGGVLNFKPTDKMLNSPVWRRN